MFEAFLVTTSTEGLKALGSAPQRSYELVTGTLRARLGDQAALLFAEPVATQYGDRFDWYAPIAGKARLLSDLPPEAQQEVRADLAARVAAIRAEAQGLGESDAADDQRLSEALLNALEIPDEAAIHVIEDAQGKFHPVLVNWSWVRETQKAVRGVLSGLDTRPETSARKAAALAAAAPAPPPPVAADRSGLLGWLLVLGWLLLAMLLGAILYLMIAACGISGRGALFFCPPPGPQASVPAAERLALEDAIAQIERRIGIADNACQPAPPPPPPPPPPPAPEPVVVPPPPPAPQAPSEIDRRLNDRGAQRGDLSFSLAWNSTDDLDMFVTCPRGITVSYRNRSGCNGQLDVDANATRTRNDPVENIFFNAPSPGQYQVRVNLYGSRSGGGTKSFQLQVRQRDGTVETFNGTVSNSNRNWTRTITIRG